MMMGEVGLTGCFLVTLLETLISIISSVRRIIHIIKAAMKPVDSNRKIKHFKHSLRPSQSLHARFFKSSCNDVLNSIENSNP